MLISLTMVVSYVCCYQTASHSTDIFCMYMSSHMSVPKVIADTNFLGRKGVYKSAEFCNFMYLIQLIEVFKSEGDTSLFCLSKKGEVIGSVLLKATLDRVDYKNWNL